MLPWHHAWQVQFGKSPCYFAGESVSNAITPDEMANQSLAYLLTLYLNIIRGT